MRAKIKVISSSLIFKIISTLIVIVSISAIFVCNYNNKSIEINAASTDPNWIGYYNGADHYSTDPYLVCTTYLGMDCYIDKTNPNDAVVYLTGIQTDILDADGNGHDTNEKAPYANCNTYNQFDMYSVRKHVVINAKIINGNGLFSNCGNLESIDIQSNADFSELKQAYKMFINCNNVALTSLDFSNVNLNNLESANAMFEGCSNITKFTFATGTTFANLSNAYHMFKKCSSLTSLNLSGWTINGTTDAMFEGCSALNSLTFLSTANTYNSTNAYHMFYGCSSLTSLNLSGWTINGTTDAMFEACGALSTLEFSSTANTYNSINAYHAFKGTALTELDLSGWAITGTAKSMFRGSTDSMFEYSTNLSTVKFSKTANTYNSNNAYHLFKGTSITSLDLSGWAINGTTEGMFETCTALSTLTFSSAENTYKSTNTHNMFNRCNALTSLDLSNFDFTSVSNCEGMFSECKAIKAIKFGSKCTFAGSTSFSWMFNYCEQLRYSTFTSDNDNTLFSVSMFDTSSATTMERMFYYCTSISELNLGSFNTKLVTNAKEMFKNSTISTFTFGTNCTFDACENMSGMFGDNQCLSQLDISNFNTAACTDISSFVGYDRNLTKITFPDSAFSNCTNFNSAFYGLEEAKNIDFSKLNTQSAEDMSYMFAQSEVQFHERNDLATLDLSNFDTSNVTKAEGMFSYNTKPLEIIFGDDCTFANCTTFKDMFKNSSGIKKLDLSTFSIKTGATVTDMLSNTDGLHELIIKDTTTNVTINLNGTYHLAETKVIGTGATAKTVVKKVTGTTYTQIPPSTSPSTPTTIYLIKEYDTETHEIKHEFTEDGVCSICGFENYYLGTYNSKTYHVSDIEEEYTYNGSPVDYFEWHGMKVYVKVLDDGKQVGFMIGEQTDTVASDDNTEGNAKYAPYAIYDETKNNRTVDGVNINIDAIVVNAKITDLNCLFKYSIPTEIIFDEKSKLVGVSNTVGEAGFPNMANFDYTFMECKAQTIDMEDFITTGVALHYFRSMCHGAKELEALIWPDDMSGENVISLNCAFNGTENLETMDIKVFKETSKLDTMYCTFNGCGLTSLVFDETFDTSKVTNAGCCFANSSMESITFGQYCTFENCTDFHSMFENCNKLKYSTYTSESDNTPFSVLMFNTSKATNMNSMFKKTSFTSLNLSSWNTASVIDASGMFNDNRNIKSITFGPSCTFAACTNMNDMFRNTQGLLELDLTYFNTKNVLSASYFLVNAPIGDNLILGKDCTFEKCKDFSHAFEGMFKATNKFDLSKLNTSSATNMSGMFYQFGATIDSLSILDLSNFDTSNVTDASNMFHHGSTYGRPVEIIFGTNCTFEKCSNFTDMFSNLDNIKKLDLSTFSIKDNANVTNMFLNTNGLHELIIKNATSNVTINLNGTYHLAVTEVNELGKTVVKKVTDTTYTEIAPSTLTALSYLIKEYDTTTHEIKHEFTNGVCSICGYEDYYLGTYDGISYHVSDITDSYTYNGSPVDYFEWHGMKVYVKVIGDGKQVGFMVGDQTSAVPDDGTEGNAYYAPYAIYNETVNNRKVNGENINIDAIVVNAKIVYLDSLFRHSIPTEIIFGENSVLEGVLNAYSDEVELGFENAADFDWTFNYCKAQKIDMKKFKTTGVALHGFNSMCNSAFDLKTLIWPDDMIGKYVTSLNCAFYATGSLETMDMTVFKNTSKLDDMYDVFGNCGLTSLTFDETFDTSKVTNVAYCFQSTSMQSITFGPKCTFESVQDFSTMFYSNGSIKSLNLSMFNTKKATKTDWMFTNCNNLQSITFGTNCTFEKCTSFGGNSHDFGMFCGCSSLTSLDLSMFDTSSAVYMQNMFRGCTNLKAIKFGTKFTCGNCTDFHSMFEGCNNLKYSTFTSESDKTPFSVSMFNTTNVTNMSSMFSGCSSLEALDVSNFDTTKVTNMSYMFSGCNSLVDLDVSNKFNTTNVTNMLYMFLGCSSLKPLDVSNFDTTKVINMGGMFDNCSSLETLDLSNFVTTNVTNMNSMFYGCSSLETLDLSKFNTTNVTNMGNMFYGCSSLKALNVSNFVTTNVTKMNEMFRGCSSLETLDVSNKFKTTNVTDMSSMFNNCSSLKALDLSTFSIKDGANVSNMFSKTNGMHELIIKNEATNVTINLNGTYHLAETKVIGSGATAKTVVKKVTDTTYTEIAPNTLTTVSYLIKEYNTTTHEIKHEFTNGICSICGYEDIYLGTYNSKTYHVSDIEEEYTYNGSTVDYFEWHGMKVYVKVIGEKQVGFMIGDQTSAVPNNESLEENAYYAPYASYDETINNRTVNGENINIDAIVVNAKILYLDSLFRYSIPTEIIFGENSVLKGVSNPYSDEVALGFENAADFLYTFNGCNAQIIDMEKFKTTGVAIHDFNSICNYADKLITLKWPEDMTGKYVTGMSYAFYKTGSLATMDITVFEDTSRLHDMPFAFQWCGLTSLVFADEFDTRNVTSADYCFADSSMESITFGENCTFENVTGFSSVFKDNHSIKSLDLRYFNTKKATNAQWMFSGCNNLQSITFGTNCTFENCTNFGCPDDNNRGMFSGCSSLTSLDLSMFDTKSAKDMSHMFKGCTNLKAIKFGTKFKCENCTDFHSMFEGCNNLQYSTYTSENNTPFDISMFDTSSATNMNSMFSGMTNITELDISSFDMSSATTTNIFDGDEDLELIKIPAKVNNSDKPLLPTKKYGWRLLDSAKQNTSDEGGLTVLESLQNKSSTSAVYEKADEPDLELATVEGTLTKPYIGKQITIDDLVVKFNGQTLVNGTDYSFALDTDFNAKTHNLTITGLGDFVGQTKLVSYEITKAIVNIDLSSSDYSSTLHQEKIYDGTANGSSDITIETAGVEGETLVTTFTSTYSSKDVGKRNIIYVPTLASVSGGQEKTTNYNVTYDNTTLTNYGSITPKRITYTLGTLDKTYDGTNTQSVSVTINSGEVCAGDIDKVTISSPITETFESSNVGTYYSSNHTSYVPGKKVTLSEISLSGDESDNYFVNAPAAYSGTIGTIGLSEGMFNSITDSYEYTGKEIKPEVTINASYVDQIDPSRDLIITYSNNINVTNEAVITITANPDGNFSTSTVTLNFTITEKEITIDLSSDDYSTALHQVKDYDGTVDGRSDITIETAGVEGETLVTTFTSTYSSKDQGTRNIIYVPTLASVSGGQGKTTNYDVTYDNTTLTNYGTINRKEIHYTLGSLDKAYDGTNKNSNVIVTINNGEVFADDIDKVTISSPITATFESSNVGTYTSNDESGNKVTLSEIKLDGTGKDNYFVNQPTSYSGTIGAIGLSEGMFNSITDSYEYTGKEIKPEVTINASYVDQIDPSRDLIITYSNNINVTNEAVITITANPDGNFSTSTVTLNFTITEKEITVDLSSDDYSTALHQEKDYDGTVDGRDDITIETAGVEGETLVTTFTSTYSSKDQGTRNIIYVPTLASVSGGQGKTSNYNVTYNNKTLTNYGTINRKEITYTLGTLDKTYDGTKTQSVSVTINGGVVSGEEGLVSINPSTITETFEKSDVGTYTSNDESGNKVTLSEITLDGTGKDNYFVKQPSSFTGEIKPMGLTSEMFKSIPAKVYTGVQITPSIEIADSYLSQIDITRDLDIEYGTNIDAGTNSGVVTISAKSTGNFAGSGDVTLHFDITRKEITIDLSADVYKETLTYERIYDSTTNVDVTGKTLNTPGVEGETLVTTITSAVFADKNVGENKTITYTPAFTSVSGGRGNTSNYTVTYKNNELAYGEITPKQITYTTSTTKEFDDNDVSSTVITLNTSDICDDDKTKVGVTSPVAGTYDNKNVGTDKNVTPSSVSVVLTGDEKGNYYCVDLSGLKGSITLPSGRIHVSEITDEIIYDGTAHEPALTIMYDSNNDGTGDVSLIKGTDYRVEYTSNINAGTANAKITYINNYDGTPNGNVSFTIKAKEVSIDLNEYIDDLKQSKTYDSTVNASNKDITKEVTDVTPNETLHFELTAEYSNKNYGTRDLIYTPTFTSVTGGQELTSNYNITYANGVKVSDSVTTVTLSNAGTIDRKEIHYTLGTLDKAYDGTNTNTNVTVTINSGEVFADDIDKVTISSPITATFESSNVGTYYSEDHASYVYGKKVILSTISLSGDESNNYFVNPPTSYSGTIGAMTLSADMFDYSTSEIYTGMQIKPAVTVKSAYTSLIDIDRDLDIEYGTNIDAGTDSGVITVKAKSTGNFAGSSDVTLNFDITPYNVTIYLSADVYKGTLTYQRIYDSTTNVDVTGMTLNTPGLNGEVLVTTITSAVFDNKNVGENKTITYTPEFTSVNGGQGKTNNYNVTYDNKALTYGTITVKELSYTASAQDKTYDGDSSAVIKITDLLSNLFESDKANITLESDEISGDFKDEDGVTSDSSVGDNKIVKSSNVPVLTGEGSTNYLLKSPDDNNYSMTASIKPFEKETGDNITVSGINEDGYEFTGTNITFDSDITVKWGDVVLTKEKDYKLSYTDNINVNSNYADILSNPQLNIHLMGNFMGEFSEPFKINKKVLTISDITLSNSTPILKERDGDSKLDDEDKLVMTYTNSVNGDIVKFTYTDADYEKNGTAFSEEGQNLDIKAKEICINTDTSINSKQILNNYEFVTTDYTFSSIGEIDDSIGPKIISIESVEQKTYGLGQVIRFKITSDEPMTAPSGSTFTIKFTEDLGVVKTATYTGTGNGAYSTEYVLTYTVGEGESASDGLTLSEIEVSSLGFTDKYGNGVTFSDMASIIASSVTSFSNTFINTSGVLLEITADCADTTDSEVITYTFKFTTDASGIDETTFTLDDIYVIHDDTNTKDYDYLNTYKDGEITKVDDKTFTLKVSNRDFIGEDDTNGKNFILGIEAGKISDSLGNKSSAASKVIKVDRTLSPVTSDVTSGSIVKGSKLITLTPHANSYIAYRLNEALGTQIIRTDKDAYSFKLSDSDIAEKLINGTITFYDTISSGVEKFANSVANVFTFTLRNKEHVYHDVMTEANDNDEEGIKPFITDSEDMTTLGVKTENVSKLSNISNTSLHDYVAENIILEKENITDSDTLRRYIDDFVEIKTKFDDDDEFGKINDDYDDSYDYEKLMIMYEELNPHQKAIIKATIVPITMGTENEKSYYELLREYYLKYIMGHKVRKDMETNEEANDETVADTIIEVFGVINNTIKEPTDKIKVVVEKITDQSDIDVIETKLETTEDYKKDNSNEKILAPYDIYLAKVSDGSRVEVAPDTTILVKLELPPQFANEIIHIFHIHDGESSEVIDNVAYDKYALDNKCIVYFKADMFSDFVLTSATKSLVVSKDTTEAEGEVSPRGVLALSDEETEKSININVPSETKAEVYINGELKDTITKVGATEYIVKDINEITYVVVKFKVNKTEKPQDDNPTTLTIIRGITVEYVSDKHEEVISGYQDKTFRPNENITREEVAAMIARQDKGYSENINYREYLNGIKDVKKTSWSANYLGYCVMKGIIVPNANCIRPNSKATRAEVAKMIVTIKDYNTNGLTSSFSDSNGHWYDGYVAALEDRTIISGYKDHTFKGTDKMTRAEFTKVMNLASNRFPNINKVSRETIKETLKKFKDVKETSWYFKYLVEMSNEHAVKDMH